jgi:hypothetical protein
VPQPQGARAANHGVMTHAMVSRFEPASEGHTDPGSGYPLAHVLAMARGYVKAGGWARPGETPAPKPTPKSKFRFAVRGNDLKVISHANGRARWFVRHPRLAGKHQKHLHFDEM